MAHNQKHCISAPLERERDARTCHIWVSTLLEASCGSEAVRIARQHRGPIHLLLTDVVMPGMNGRAVAENLTESRPETRVVYMSGYTGFSDYGLTNLDAVIIKPFTRHALLQRLREVIALEEKSQRI